MEGGRETYGPASSAPSQPAPEASESTPSGSTHPEASGKSDPHETATPGAPANDALDELTSDATSPAPQRASEC